MWPDARPGSGRRTANGYSRQEAIALKISHGRESTVRQQLMDKVFSPSPLVHIFEITRSLCINKYKSRYLREL